MRETTKRLIELVTERGTKGAKRPKGSRSWVRYANVAGSSGSVTTETVSDTRSHLTATRERSLAICCVAERVRSRMAFL
jgi:hypothetical protein